MSGSVWLDPEGGWSEASPEYQLTPVWYSGSEVGTYDRAEIEGAGSKEALWAALGWLNRRVQIRNEYGTTVWAGFINEVRISLGGLVMGVSLEPMANRVKVIYSYEDANGAPADGDTGYSDDSESITRYGVKEDVESIGDADEALALKRQSEILRARGRPKGTPSLTKEKPGLRLICLGQWHKLGWKFYENLVGRVVYEPVSESVEDVLGWGFTSDQVGFYHVVDSIHDLGARFDALKVGDRFSVSGSANNNTVFTVTETAPDDEQEVYTATTISFDPNDDIMDSAGGLGFVREQAMIRVQGSSLNSGYHLINGAGSSHVTTDTGWKGVVVSEGAGASITITQGNGVRVAQGVAKELPGATVTVWALSQQIMQIFQVDGAWRFHQVAIKVGKVGNPVDNLFVEIRTVSGGNPTGVVVDGGFAPGGQISETPEWRWFRCQNVQAAVSTDYALVVRRSGAMDGENYYVVELNEEEIYVHGAVKHYDGFSWIARTPAASMPFRVYGSLDNALQIKAMLTAAGVFSVVDANVLSSVYTQLWRGGENRILDEVAKLIAAQTSSGKRLQAKVGLDGNNVTVVEEPTASAENDDRWMSNGVIQSAGGTEAERGVLPVGRWLVLGDLPSSLDVMLAGVSPVMVGTAEYDCKSGEMRVEPRLG